MRGLWLLVLVLLTCVCGSVVGKGKHGDKKDKGSRLHDDPQLEHAIVQVERTREYKVFEGETPLQLGKETSEFLMAVDAVMHGEDPSEEKRAALREAFVRLGRTFSLAVHTMLAQLGRALGLTDVPKPSGVTVDADYDAVGASSSWDLIADTVCGVSRFKDQGVRVVEIYGGGSWEESKFLVGLQSPKFAAGVVARVHVLTEVQSALEVLCVTDDGDKEDAAVLGQAGDLYEILVSLSPVSFALKSPFDKDNPSLLGRLEALLTSNDVSPLRPWNQEGIAKVVGFLDDASEEALSALLNPLTILKFFGKKKKSDTDMGYSCSKFSRDRKVLRQTLEALVQGVEGLAKMYMCLPPPGGKGALRAMPTYYHEGAAGAEECAEKFYIKPSVFVLDSKTKDRKILVRSGTGDHIVVEDHRGHREDAKDTDSEDSDE